jgi:hypothetical protein
LALQARRWLIPLGLSCTVQCLENRVAFVEQGRLHCTIPLDQANSTQKVYSTSYSYAENNNPGPGSKVGEVAIDHDAVVRHCHQNQHQGSFPTEVITPEMEVLPALSSALSFVLHIRPNVVASTTPSLFLPFPSHSIR